MRPKPGRLRRRRFVYIPISPPGINMAVRPIFVSGEAYVLMLKYNYKFGEEV